MRWGIFEIKELSKYDNSQIENGLLKELFSTGKMMEPSIARISDYKMALSRDEATIFIDSEGNPTQKSVLTWSELPIAMG